MMPIVFCTFQCTLNYEALHCWCETPIDIIMTLRFAFCDAISISATLDRAMPQVSLTDAFRLFLLLFACFK